MVDNIKKHIILKDYQIVIEILMDPEKEGKPEENKSIAVEEHKPVI